MDRLYDTNFDPSSSSDSLLAYLWATHTYTHTHTHMRACSWVSPPALIRYRNYRDDLSRPIPSAGDSSLNVSLRIFDLARCFIAPALLAIDWPAGCEPGSLLSAFSPDAPFVTVDVSAYCCAYNGAKNRRCGEWFLRFLAALSSKCYRTDEASVNSVSGSTHGNSL